MLDQALLFTLFPFKFYWSFVGSHAIVFSVNWIICYQFLVTRFWFIL